MPGITRLFVSFGPNMGPAKEGGLQGLWYICAILWQRLPAAHTEAVGVCFALLCKREEVEGLLTSIRAIYQRTRPLSRALVPVGLGMRGYRIVRQGIAAPTNDRFDNAAAKDVRSGTAGPGASRKRGRPMCRMNCQSL